MGEQFEWFILFLRTLHFNIVGDLFCHKLSQSSINAWVRKVEATFYPIEKVTVFYFHRIYYECVLKLYHVMLQQRFYCFLSKLNRHNTGHTITWYQNYQGFFMKHRMMCDIKMQDYGIDFDDHNHPIEAFQCSCGSQYCRDRRGRS